ncbi:MAG: hypothetical protein ACAH59_10200 [Pseudobdellovibrionaceae bacterium]
MKKWILTLTLILLGCTSGNCRSQKEQKVDEKKINEAAAQISSNSQSRVKVYKYDGSQQCGMGKSVSLSEMQKELAGLAVYSADNRPDGLMHIQVCGSPTGRANVYEIDATSLEAAKKKGFKEWTFE